MKTNQGRWFLPLLGAAIAGAAMESAAAPIASFAREKEVAAVVKVRSIDDAESTAKWEWNLKTLEGAYNDVGSRNGAWDAPAHRALEGFARMRVHQDAVPPGLADDVSAAVAQAFNAGCDDPMIRYLHTRMVLRFEDGMTDRRLLEVMREIDRSMRDARYHSLRKFYVTFRRFTQLGFVDRTNSAAEANSLISACSNHLHRALQDKTIPTEEAYEAWASVREEARSKYFENLIGQLVLQDLAALGRTGAVVQLIKGEALIQAAWTERGGDTADKVTVKGWKGYNENLATAADELNQAWRMDPSQVKIATAMIRLEMGQGMGTERMELWFNRAMELDTNSMEACRAKLLYLDPRWYGNAQATISFGRECVRSTRWGGEVPLTLLRAHEGAARSLPATQRNSYWKKPGVWPDVKASFEKFFAVNPQNKSWRQSYALYAYRAEQWDDFNKQIPLLGKVNYNLFGGKAEWDRIVALAGERATK